MCLAVNVPGSIAGVSAKMAAVAFVLISADRANALLSTQSVGAYLGSMHDFRGQWKVCPLNVILLPKQLVEVWTLAMFQLGGKIVMGISLMQSCVFTGNVQSPEGIK